MKPTVSATASAPVYAGRDRRNNHGIMPALARQNGGQAVARVKNFAEAMDAFVADAADFYVLGFDSTPSAAADEFHSIAVKVDRPGVTVLQRASSYYAQP